MNALPMFTNYVMYDPFNVFKFQKAKYLRRVDKGDPLCPPVRRLGGRRK